MKYDEKKIILLIIIFDFSLSSWGQCTTPAPTTNTVCEDGKGISTNPDNPINCEGADNQGNVVPWRQNHFDWRVQSSQPIREHFDVYIPGANGVGVPNTSPVINPFTDPSDAEYYPHITQGDDSYYEPLDGWELMKVEFGSPTGSANPYYPKLPYMMLYNKYSGTLRFFGALIDLKSTCRTIEVKMTIPRYSPGKTNDKSSAYQNELKATNLLSIQGESIQPLDQETNENTLSAFVKCTNNDDVFFWFDVPLAYDPCICLFKSQFDISFEFAQFADINITGDLTDSIKATPRSGGYPVKSFNNAFAAGISAADGIKTGGAVLSLNFVNLIDIFKNNPKTSANDRANLTKLKAALSCEADIFHTVKGNYKGLSNKDEKKQAFAGKKLLDGDIKFYSAAAKGCLPDKSAIAISGRIKTKGTVSSSGIMSGIRIALALPGSKWDIPLKKRTYKNSASNDKLAPAYPMYNERLGTFALLKTPEISVREIIESCPVNKRTMWSMRLTSDIEYSFNPLLNLNSDKTLIFARIVLNKNTPSLLSVGSFSDSNDPCFPPNSYSNPLNMEHFPNSEYKIASPYMPLDYIKSMPMRFSWKLTNPTKWMKFPSLAEDNVFIQFTIVAESNNVGSDGKKNLVYQILTFPVKFNTVTTDPNGTVVNGNYIQDAKDFDVDEVFSSNTDLYFEGPVFISAKLSTTPGAKLRIFSLKGFELEPGAEVSPDVELIPGPHLQKDAQPEATFSEVNSFCSNTNNYKANKFSAIALQEMINDSEHYREQKKQEALEKLTFNKFTFNIYPKPNIGVFNLAFNNNLQQNGTLTMMDISGKVVHKQTLSKGQMGYLIYANNLSAGVYFARIKVGEYSVTEKIIIQENN